MTGPPPLDALVAAAQADPAALDALLAALLPQVRRMCYRWCLDVALADDLTQDSLIRIVRALPSYQAGHFNGWLARLVLNVVRDSARAGQRNQARTALIEEADTVPAAGNPEQALMISDALRQLNELPTAQREALWLVAGLGYTEDEAAALLDCPPGTIAWRIHEARRKLRSRAEGAA